MFSSCIVYTESQREQWMRFELILWHSLIQLHHHQQISGAINFFKRNCLIFFGEAVVRYVYVWSDDQEDVAWVCIPNHDISGNLDLLFLMAFSGCVIL